MPFRIWVGLLSVALAVPLGAGAMPAHVLQAAAVAGPETPPSRSPGDAFGTEVTLPKRTIIFVTGNTSWDNVYKALVDAFRALDAYLKKAGIEPQGPAMTIYTETDDNGFKFRAARPIAEVPASLPEGNIAIGEAPTGKALKFVHRGTYDEVDTTYEAITNYLDDRDIEAKDSFIEEYVSDLASGPDNMVINVLVPVK